MENMDRSNIENTLIQLMTRCRERAFCKYMKNDREYERLLKIACEADKAYYKMDLSPEQRDQIDSLLTSRAEAGDCELTLTYIAGLLDGVVLLRKMGFLDMYVSDEDESEEEE